MWQCHLRNVSTLSNRTLPPRLPRLYQQTNSGWLYALIDAYHLERFFNWQIAAIGLVCLAIAYGLCRVIVCAVCFIRRRFEKS